MGKVVFHKFTSDIYPINVYITITNDQTAVTDRFSDGYGLEIGDLPENCDALCMTVVDKPTKERGNLILFRKKDFMTTSTMAHESFHCAENICRELGVVYNNDENNEAIAYLIGWIVDCCEQVKRNKFKYE